MRIKNIENYNYIEYFKDVGSVFIYENRARIIGCVHDINKLTLLLLSNVKNNSSNTIQIALNYCKYNFINIDRFLLGPRTTPDIYNYMISKSHGNCYNSDNKKIHINFEYCIFDNYIVSPSIDVDRQLNKNSYSHTYYTYIDWPQFYRKERALKYSNSNTNEYLTFLNSLLPNEYNIFIYRHAAYTTKLFINGNVFKYGILKENKCKHLQYIATMTKNNIISKIHELVINYNTLFNKFNGSQKLECEKDLHIYTGINKPNIAIKVIQPGSYARTTGTFKLIGKRKRNSNISILSNLIRQLNE